MIAPPIYHAFTFSVVIHIFLFITAFFLIKHSDTHKKVQPYIVSLVDDMKYSTAAPSDGLQDKAVKMPEPKINQSPTPSRQQAAQKAEKSGKQDENIIKERIAALEAKKKIEKIVALRKVIDIEGQRNVAKGAPQKSSDKAAPAGSISASAGSDYYSMIVKRIRQEWIFPENLDRNLEAIISIKIAKDGSIKIDKIEKSSGNPVFDRYALRAINKASPLPPPPHAMEVGVRFYP